MRYLPRTLDRELDELLSGAPAIALDGPKGAGKTDTASRRAAQSWFLDSPQQRGRLQADFDLRTLAPKGTILIDEWQRLPQILDSVRRRVDAGVQPGRFLLTGSATPTTAEGTHSGAGRIFSLRMRPMGLHERGEVQPSVSLGTLLEGGRADIGGETEYALANYIDAIVTSGFPGALPLSRRMQRSFLESYIVRVIDRDLPDVGHEVRRPDTLRRWLMAYAAATSTTTAYSRLLDSTSGGDGMQPAKSTTIAYRDHLTQLFLLDPLPGWTPARSPMTNLRQAPKHHLADPALATTLLNLTPGALLAPHGSSMVGPLFESLVTLGVRVMAQANDAKVSHLRTKSGDREIDLIIENIDGRIVALEVKLSPGIDDKDVRHLLWLRDQIPDRVSDLVVISTGAYAYRRQDGVAVVPLALLGP
ncbi:MAG: DUF4143 domain-containing protein [Actinomycetaceae bacterium]|nr:DUF4143 domain-containing protein [Actinomycetaceae bacterium]